MNEDRPAVVFCIAAVRSTTGSGRLFPSTTADASCQTTDDTSHCLCAKHSIEPRISKYNIQ